MLLRAVVVTYSPGPFLAELLTSVPRAATVHVPITIVDNGSTDGRPELAAKVHGVTLVSADRNLGYGGAANLGVRGATEEWLLLANPDVRFEPESIDVLLAAVERWPRGGVLGPAILTPDGRLYPSSRHLPTLGRGIAHAALGWAWPTNPWTAAYRREGEEPREGVTGWLSGACLLIRREAFEGVGGFDPDYFMYFEDVDLCERMTQAGWDVVYVPTALVVHHGGHSTSQNLEAMSKAHHESAYRYLSRRYRGTTRIPLRVLLRCGLWLRYQLSRRVEKVSHGAQPTRSARVLPSPGWPRRRRHPQGSLPSSE